MGEVWEATHEVVRAPVALKFLRQDVTDNAELVAMYLERFRFEAQLSARLAPITRHVVAVSDAGTHRGEPYIVMELMPGGSLADVLAAQGPLSPRQLLPILRQVASALTAAHRLNVVHRDLKPTNILLADTAEGLVVKVCDFGVAKATTPTPGLDLPRATAEGALVGSPGYMSPEQIAGNVASAASDQWSLAAVAYEALTGRACVSGATAAATMLATLEGYHAPLRTVAPHLPRALDAWMERALSVSPTKRFASIDEMIHAFEVAAERPTPGDRRRLLVVATMTMLAPLAALGIARALDIRTSTRTFATVASSATAATSTGEDAPAAASAGTAGREAPAGTAAGPTPVQAKVPATSPAQKKAPPSSPPSRGNTIINESEIQ